MNREEIREMVKEMIGEALKEFAQEIIERKKIVAEFTTDWAIDIARRLNQCNS